VDDFAIIIFTPSNSSSSSSLIGSRSPWVSEFFFLTTTSLSCVLKNSFIKASYPSSTSNRVVHTYIIRFWIVELIVANPGIYHLCAGKLRHPVSDHWQNLSFPRLLLEAKIIHIHHSVWSERWTAEKIALCTI
jgi:hypothetical protein